MPKVSVNILTKNRAGLLQKALASVLAQTFKDFEVVVINDGSTDHTADVIQSFNPLIIQSFNHSSSVGIIKSRQEALEKSTGEYVAILDDDDQWSDKDKLKKQVEFLDSHKDYVLVGGGVRISNFQFPISNFQKGQAKFRVRNDAQIRKTMLLRNNFFTSTVMFRRESARKAGGFIIDGVDLCEDYDLWLRLGKLGKMHNFQEVFTLYAKPQYNIEKFKLFLAKQLNLIGKYKTNYTYYYLSSLILKTRLIFGF